MPSASSIDDGLGVGRSKFIEKGGAIVLETPKTQCDPLVIRSLTLQLACIMRDHMLSRVTMCYQCVIACHLCVIMCYPRLIMCYPRFIMCYLRFIIVWLVLSFCCCWHFACVVILLLICQPPGPTLCPGSVLKNVACFQCLRRQKPLVTQDNNQIIHR